MGLTVLLKLLTSFAPKIWPFIARTIGADKQSSDNLGVANDGVEKAKINGFRMIRRIMLIGLIIMGVGFFFFPNFMTNHIRAEPAWILAAIATIFGEVW